MEKEEDGNGNRKEEEKNLSPEAKQDLSPRRQLPYGLARRMWRLPSDAVHFQSFGVLKGVPVMAMLITAKITKLKRSYVVFW